MALFSFYFARNAAAYAISEKEAALLDRLVMRLYGTFEAMKMVRAKGGHTPRRELETNTFAEAAASAYNFSGLLKGVNTETRDFNDWQEILELSRSLMAKINPVIDFYSQQRSSSQGSVTENVAEDAMGALQGKLRFEAAMYEATKKQYGITVELPS